MGRINPLRAGIALTAGLAATAITGTAMAQGGITANLALSGTLFDIVIGNVDGKDFSLFVGGEKLGDQEEPVSRLRFGEAIASDLCVSATLPDVPGVGTSTFSLRVPGQGTVQAQGLLVGAPLLRGSLQLQNPQIGIDASQVHPQSPAGAWGIYSQDVKVQAEEINATSIGADSLSAQGFTIKVERGDNGGCL